MDVNYYQRLAARTLSESPGFEVSDADLMILWNAIGLAGEAGEVADLVKKGIFHQHGLARAKVKEELGDVCWYVSALATKLGFNLSEILTANIEKLEQRYPEGYSAAASIDRDV